MARHQVIVSHRIRKLVYMQSTPTEAPQEGAVGEEPGSALTDLVIITGFSGAGKSTAMAVFEDEGYFCVDNLPSEMIRSLVELFMHQGSKVARAAVVSDVRGGSYFEGLAAMLDDLRAAGLKHAGPVPRGRRAGAADALQGDPAPAPARARRGAWLTASPGSVRRWPPCATAPTW